MVRDRYSGETSVFERKYWQNTILKKFNHRTPDNGEIFCNFVQFWREERLFIII